MSEPIVYKPQTTKGPVILLAKEPKSPPTMTLADGTVVTAVRADKKGGTYYNEGAYQFVFPSSVLGQSNSTLNVDGKTQKLTDSNKSYRGNDLGSLTESSKGAIGDPSSGGAGGMNGASLAGKYGVIPENLLSQFPDAQQAAFHGISDVKYTETSVKNFAKEFANFNTGIFSQNNSSAKGMALDELDTELQGLKKFVPDASNLKRSEVSNDNSFNQSQRTSQVQSTVPGVLSDLQAQAARARSYSNGELPDAGQDRALELGVRSSAADAATSSGFGAQSGAGRKASALMSADKRFQIEQYGDSLTASNSKQLSDLLLAPTEYSNAGDQISVTPSVSGSQLQTSDRAALNSSTLLDPATALTSQINQQQFKTNLDVSTKEYNATAATNTDQFNVTNLNNFALSKFAYQKSYADAVAQAFQNNINTGVSLDQQAAATKAANDARKNTQKANTVGSIVQGVTTIGAVAAAFI